MKVSVLSAVYNEKDILETVDSWVQYLRNYPEIEAFEIILCDDCSSVEFYNQMCNDLSIYPEVIILRNQENEGPGYSFARGMEYAKMEYSLIIDSDGQFPIENVKTILLNHKKFGSVKDHVVFTYRDVKYDNFINVFGQRISGFLCNRIYQTKLKDFTCAMKLAPTALLQHLVFDAKYMNYSLDHTSKILESGSSYSEVGVACNQKNEKKRGLISEFKRAINRYRYISYLRKRKNLIEKRVLFNYSKFSNSDFRNKFINFK